jgi:quinoprotein glucose dehydrogenase
MAIYDTSNEVLLSGTDAADVIYGYPKPTQPATVEIADELYRPLFATAPKGDKDHLYVVSQGGAIMVHDLKNPGSTPKAFLNIADQLDNADEAGLLGFTFHPNFLQNGKCYVN